MRGRRVVRSARGPRRSSPRTAPHGMGAVGGDASQGFDAPGRPTTSQISSPSSRVLSPLSSSSRPVYEPWRPLLRLPYSCFSEVLTMARRSGTSCYLSAPRTADLDSLCIYLIPAYFAIPDAEVT
jgi:hypothetical protein